MPSSSTKRHSRRPSHDSFEEDANTSQSAQSGHDSKKRTPGFLKRLGGKKKKDKQDSSRHDKDSDSAEESGASLSDAAGTHMEGSRFLPTDVCPSCDEPRGRRAVCLVSRYHHGTDQPVGDVATPKKKGLLSKFKSHSRTTSGVGSAAPLPPLAPATPDVKKSKSKSKSKHSDDVKAAESGHDDETPHSAKRASQSPSHTRPAEPTEAAGDVQYYCYVGEDGNTYYYAASGADQAQADNTTEGENATHATSGHSASAATPAAHEVEQVCYQCVDDEGNTQYYYAYPPSAEQAPEDAHGVEPPQSQSTSSHRRKHALRDVPPAYDSDASAVDGEEDESESDNRRHHHSRHSSDKPSTRRGSRLKNLFRKKRGSRASSASDDADRRSTASSGSSDDTKKHNKSKKSPKKKSSKSKGMKDKKSKNDAARRASDSCSEAAAHSVSDDDTETSEYDRAAHSRSAKVSASSLDAAIAARARELERDHGSDARKSFEKGVRKAVKELEETEKSERHQLTRQRRVFVEDLARRKRAIAFEMRDVERRVNRALERGEPQ